MIKENKMNWYLFVKSNLYSFNFIQIPSAQRLFYSSLDLLLLFVFVVHVHFVVVSIITIIVNLFIIIIIILGATEQ